ncbi:MAG: septum formation initiator family protein [Filomicrobium sp.]
MKTALMLSVLLMLTSAFALYAVNHDTRKLEAGVAAQEKTIEKVQKDIAILKAERAHLARPERIGKEARELGLVPANRNQFTGYADPDPLKRGRGRIESAEDAVGAGGS